MQRGLPEPMFWPFNTRDEAPATYVPEGQRFYTIGDIHGSLDLLQDLHTRILADAADVPEGIEKTIIYLGDYVDRGPDSKGVIDLFLSDPLPGFERVHLMGNHEEMFLAFLDQAAFGEAWFSAGGGATVRSYGIAIEGSSLRAERYQEIRDAFQGAVPAPHIRFLSTLRMSYEVGNCLFVHAGIRPGRNLADQIPRDLLWIKEPFTRSKIDHGRVIVHGHSSRKRPERRANRINLDTRAWQTKRLTCLILEGTTQRFLSTRD